MGKKRGLEATGANAVPSQKKRKSSDVGNQFNNGYSVSYRLSQSPRHERDHPSRGHATAQRPKPAELTKQFSGQVDEHVERLTPVEHVVAALNRGQVLRSEQSLDSHRAALDTNYPNTISMEPIPPYRPSKPPQQLGKQSQPRSTIPSLPAIKDKSLADLPFRHQGTIGAPKLTTFDASYERLEFLGDAYIEIIATRLIYSRFWHLSAGRLSQVREMLVKNETLAEYSVAYGFDKQVQIPQTTIPGGKAWIKTMGDVFEAYAAAVVLSDSADGFATLEDWLTELWAPKLMKMDIPMQPITNAVAKQDLAKKVLGKGIKIQYIDERLPEKIEEEAKTWYYVGAYITGWGWQNQHLGSGKGLNKSEAGIDAAMDALTNPLVEEIAAVKREFDVKVKAEREQQNQ